MSTTAYPPPADFAAKANATSDLYDAAEADRLAFWAEQANRLSWQTPFEEVLDWSKPLPPEQHAKPSQALLDESAAVRKAYTKGQTMLDYYQVKFSEEPEPAATATE